jgi:hypothetical protein
MELNEKEKKLLLIFNMFKAVKNKFNCEEIYFHVCKIEDDGEFDPVNNWYPLLMTVEKNNQQWKYNWFEFEGRPGGRMQINEPFFDKENKPYMPNDFKAYIKDILPEAFEEIFYEANLRLSSNKLEERLKPLLLSLELNNDLPIIEQQNNKRIKL